MKGCLKFNSTPSLVDSQVHHHEHSGCSRNATASSSTTIGPASTNPTQAQTQTHRKCVAFCAEGSETVYPADEWDRTPAEPARKLSYQDLLELKEIQQSLPHANQPPDIITGRPGKQFLSGVPIVLLPLLSSDAPPNGRDSRDDVQGREAKKPSSFSTAHGRTNVDGSGCGWGPPSLTRQAQTTRVPPSFPFPPCPVPFSAPASFTSPTASSPIAPTNFQSHNKAGSLSPSPTSPSYSNRPSTTSASATYLYSNLHKQPPPRTLAQTQSRTPWTPPPSLGHLMPSLPIKPREKPKFEFITLLDSGPRSNGSTGPRAGMSDGAEGTTTEVGHPELALDSISKPPSCLIDRESERDHPDEERDLEDHDQDHDITSSSSSCPSLCTSSCSASEADTDLEHEPEIETDWRHFSSGRYGHAKGWGDESCVAKLLRPSRITANSSLSLSSPPPLFDLGVGHLLDDEAESNKTTKKPELKKKERKFILVNDMEIELDDSEEEDDCAALSGNITSSTTKETITTTTTKTTITEKTTTVTTTSGCPTSPRNITAPVPVKSTSSASLMTPPNTPPSEQVSRYGNHTPNNKAMHSPTSSSTASRGGVKANQRIGHTSRERSGSVSSDANGAGGGTSPSRNLKTRSTPVKKSKMS